MLRVFSFMYEVFYSLALLAILAMSTPLVSSQNHNDKSDALLVYGSGFVFSVREQYPTVRFEDLHFKHKRYQTFPKLFFVTEKFYEYVVYLNPGKDVPVIFSLALSKQAERASTDELAAFNEIVQSFAFLTKDVIK